MEKKIEQLLNGKFEYEQPPLLFSMEKLSVSVKAGETRLCDLYLGAEDNRKINGYVTSSSRRVVPENDVISGDTIHLLCGVDAVGLNPGDELKGWLCFTTDIGEYRLPYEIQVEREEIRSSVGAVESMEAFAGIAKRDFREAFRIFTDKSFALILDPADKQTLALYQGMTRQPVTYQHLEEFLIASGVKQPVQITLKEQGKEFYSVRESSRESFYIQRSGWGHVRLEVETKGAFLEVARKVVTDEDFIGSHYEVEFFIDRDKLGKGKAYGQIVVRSPYEILTYQVLASRDPKVEVKIDLVEKKHRLALFRDTLEFQCHEVASNRKIERMAGMDQATWTASCHFELNQLREEGCGYPEYDMFEAYLLYREGNTEDASQILKKYQNKAFTREELEFAGLYLYLCTVTGLYKDKDQAVSRLRNFYMQKGDSFLLLWLLLKIDPEYQVSRSNALFAMNEQFRRGCKSPFLYLEAWDYVCENLSLLHRLDSFWGQVFFFAAKKDLLTEELTMRLAYLSGYEKNFNESVYRAMVRGYEQFPSTDTLEAICKYIMLGNPRRKEYFRWYALAVEHGLRLTRLYEYYVETMDVTSRQKLPKSLLMYFTYNNDTLGDSKKAFIYANVIAAKEEEPSVYRNYYDSIKSFAEKKLAVGAMSEHYAVIYQEFLMSPKSAVEAEKAAEQMFTYRLYLDDKKIRKVIVRHSQMAQEEVYSCSHGVAYPRIYTEDAVILFQDDKQRRYMKTVDYSLKKLMNEETVEDRFLELGVEEPGLLLHYCENHELNKDNLDVFQRLVKSAKIGDTYRRSVRHRILDYYAAHVEGEDLDDYLKKMDYREYAPVDKQTLLDVLISRSLFGQALDIVEEFGFEGLDMGSLLKLTSRMILRTEMELDRQLLALAVDVYRAGLYDEVILMYLMKYSFGPVDEVFSIWKSAEGFDLDTYALEEKILKLLIFTSDYRKEGEAVLEDYIRQSGRERLICAYLTQVAYGIFVKEYSMSSFVRNCLMNAYMQNWHVDQVCALALFKEISREKNGKDLVRQMEKELLKRCMDQDMIFSFFRRLPADLLSPYQLDDKTCVEYHTSPASRVTLLYALDTGLGKELEYKSEPLRNVYEGIFSRVFTLFYGEKLHYYFRVETDGKVKETKEHVLTMDKVDGEQFSKYQLINQMLSARKMDKSEELLAKMQQYLGQEQFVKEMFVMEKED